MTLLIEYFFQQSSPAGATVPRAIVDTLIVSVSETTRTVVADTVGVVTMPGDPWWVTAGRTFAAFASLAVGVAAAVAAWKAASAATASVAAAERQAKATEQEIAATQRSVDIQLEQLAMMREVNSLARQQNAIALKSLAQRIRLPLRQLDPNAPGHRTLRNYAHLTDSDIAALENLARGVSTDAIRFAAKAAVPLRTIDALRRKAASINEMTGWMASAAESSSWQSAIGSANHMLEALERACDDAAA